MSETIGYRLKLVRDELGFNQSDFAYEFGVSQQSVSKYENDLIDIPEDFKIKLIDRDVNINWLLSGKGKMFIDNSQINGDQFEGELTYKEMLPILNEISKLNKINIITLLEYIQKLS